MKSIFIYGQKQILYNYINAFSDKTIKIICSTDILQAKNCDVLVLAGGGDIAPSIYGQKNTNSRSIDLKRDKDEIKLLSQFTREQKVIIGICRGLQIINVFFGGTLLQDVSGHSQVNGQDSWHEITNEKGGFTYKVFGKTNVVNSAHHQAIDNLGNGLIALSHSKDGYIEALCHKTLPIYATQFHPERMSDNNLITYFKKIIT